MIKTKFSKKKPQDLTHDNPKKVVVKKRNSKKNFHTPPNHDFPELTYRLIFLGKPNVGKSTLFNRITRSNTSIISSKSGTTRDSINRILKKNDDVLMVSDLPGWDENLKGWLDSDIHHLEKIAKPIIAKLKWELVQSDLVLLMVDIENITPEDRELHKIALDSKLPIIYCASKCDGKEQENLIGEAYEMGFKDVQLVSAKMDRGINRLIELIFKEKNKLVEKKIPIKNIQLFCPQIDYKLAIVGRPNAGKSSLFNAFLKKNRSIVSEVEGTTRDMVEDFLIHEKKKIKLIDTGGLRRKSRKKKIVEQYSVEKVIHAVNQSDIAILLIDAEQGIADQDKKIISFINNKKKSLLIAFNKWDKIKITWKEYHDDLLLTFPPLKNITCLPTSCKNRKNLRKLIEEVDALFLSRSRKIGTPELNRILQIAINQNPPPTGTLNRSLKIYYALQVQTTPPVFFFYINNLQRLTKNYHQYISKYLEKSFGLQGTPIIIRYLEKKTTAQSKYAPSSNSTQRNKR